MESVDQSSLTPFFIYSRRVIVTIGQGVLGEKRNNEVK